MISQRCHQLAMKQPFRDSGWAYLVVQAATGAEDSLGQLGTYIQVGDVYAATQLIIWVHAVLWPWHPNDIYRLRRRGRSLCQPG